MSFILFSLLILSFLIGIAALILSIITKFDEDTSQPSTQLTSVGGSSLVKEGNGPNLSIKGLTAGSGITLDELDTNVMIASEQTTLSSQGGTSLINNGTGPLLALKGLAAGSGITLDGSSSSVVTITADEVTLSSAGGTTLINDGTGPTLAIKGLTAGSGITLDGSSSSTVIITADGSEITLSSAGGTTLINDGTGPTLAIKGLTAGSGITLDGSSSSAVTIAADGTNITLTSAGGTNTLVNDGSGPTLAIKGLSAGNGISLDGTSATNLIISSTGSRSVFNQWGLVTIAGTTSDTTVRNSTPGDFSGSTVFLADSFAQGDVITLQIAGTITSAFLPVINNTYKLWTGFGVGDILLDSIVSGTNFNGTEDFMIEYTIMINATGVSGSMIGSAHISRFAQTNVVSTWGPVTVDTTVSNILAISIAPGHANGSEYSFDIRYFYIKRE